MLLYVAFQVKGIDAPSTKVSSLAMIVMICSVLVLFSVKVVRSPNIELTCNVAGNECVTVTEILLVTFTLILTLAGQETLKLAAERETGQMQTHVHLFASRRNSGLFSFHQLRALRNMSSPKI